MKLYFKDNFFNSGKTAIWNERQDSLGEVDLKSTFGFGSEGSEVGILRHRMAFFSKRYEYEAYGNTVFEITSPAFSREYQICTLPNHKQGEFNDERSKTASIRQKYCSLFC